MAMIAYQKNYQLLLHMTEEVEDYSIILLDTEGNIQNWNRGAKNIKQYESGEVLGKNFEIFYTEEDRKNNHPQKLIDTACDIGKAQDEGWRVKKDGAKFWASVSLTAMHDQDGKVIGFSQVTRDLTEKRNSEEALTRLNLAITEVEDYAIILLDLEGKVQQWNNGAERIKGYNSKEIVGQSFTKFYSEKEREQGKPLQLLEKAKVNGKVADEGWRIKKNGEKFWAHVSIHSYKDRDGKVIGFSKVIRDLTERKRTQEIQKRQEILETKNKELEQFAYVASHDLQEPLRTITSFVGLLQQEYTGKVTSATTEQYLDFIAQSASRMSALVKGLLDYSRIGKKQPFETVDCSELLHFIQADLASRISETNAILEIGPLPKVQGINTALRLLFQNLISNALKFQKQDTQPQIQVTAKEKQHSWQFQVKDNGIGIADEFKERIFIIFQRLHMRNKYEGTGIGLAHCKKIVETHGGSIWVESTPDEGSEFYFTIPK